MDELDALIPLTEVLRIGALDGDEEYTFGSVAGVAPGPDGTVYVADGQVPLIRRYDAEGRYLHDVGSSGEGPGEYSAIGGLAVSPDGVVIVFDGGLQRVSRFDADGTFLESSRTPPAFSSPHGLTLSEAADPILRVAPETGFEETRDGLVADWARVLRDGSVERLHRSPPEESVGPRYVLAGRGGLFRAFVTRTLSTTGPDGSLYVARNDAYRITRRRPDGSESIVARDVPRVAVSDEETAEWRAWSEFFAERAPQQRSDFFPVPERKPYLRDLFVDADGRLWAGRYTEAVFVPYAADELAEREAAGTPTYQWRDEPRWDLFADDGAYLGHVVVPQRTDVFYASGDQVWGVQAGDLREDYVVRWRLGAGKAGLEGR